MGKRQRTQSIKIKKKTKTKAVIEKQMSRAETMETLEVKANKAIELANILVEEEEKHAFGSNTLRALNPKYPNLSANTMTDETEEERDEDNDYPLYLNVPIFGKSEDEALEKLIDRAVLDICYHSEFEKLWESKRFINWVYSDVLFPRALEQVFETINDSIYSEYGFIGAFISTHFKREIDEYLRKLNKKSEEIRMIRKASTDDFESSSPSPFSPSATFSDKTKCVVLRRENKETK